MAGINKSYKTLNSSAESHVKIWKTIVQNCMSMLVNYFKNYLARNTDFYDQMFRDFWQFSVNLPSVKKVDVEKTLIWQAISHLDMIIDPLGMLASEHEFIIQPRFWRLIGLFQKAWPAKAESAKVLQKDFQQVNWKLSIKCLPTKEKSKKSKKKTIW